jgi:hypothetical protein
MSAENINRRLNIYINDREVVNSMRGITAEMSRVRNQMRNLNRSAEDYDEQLEHLRNTYARLTQEQARFRADLNQTPGILGRIRNALGPIASGMLAAFSVQSLVTGFASKMREAWNTIVDFDQKQADLAAIMQKSRVQIAGLTADAIKYGASTSYSAGEVSILQTELARLGKTAPEIRAMTKDVLNAATALETDLGSAATLIGGQLNSYGESANKSGKYSDIMANSVNISATSFDSLANSLPKVSKVAALNNVSFEELNATLGTLADENVAAETAGTGFRNILLESSKAGIPYKEMLEKVRKAADQGKKAVELFGKENATVAVILANSTEKIKQQTTALENSAGSSEKLAKEKMNSILGSTKNFSSAWEGLILSIEKGDGKIGKAIKGVIDLGTSFLSLVTPMKKVSDLLGEEQLGLNMLVSKITSTNVKNDERKQLLIELKNEYPDFIKNIDIETISNDDLNNALNKVNEQYIKRIALQRQVEKVESKQNDSGVTLARKLEAQEKLFKRLNSIKADNNLSSRIDYANLEKSANAVIGELTKKGSYQGLFSDVAAIKSDISVIKAFDFALKSQNASLQEQTDILERQKKSLGMNTEAENEKAKAIAAEAEAMKKLREEAKLFGMKNAMTATNEEVRIWLNAYKERMKYSGEMSEEDNKKRLKAIEDAKKHSEDLKKELESSKKELLQTNRAFEDANLESQRENYEKERALLNLEYDRKKDDTKIKVKELQNEIDKLKVEAKSPKNSKNDVDVIKAIIATKIEAQKTYGKTIISLDETLKFKLGILQEKYLNKEIKLLEETNEKALSKLKQRQSSELAGLNTLAEAKAVLANYLSAEEISKIRSLEVAKTKIKEAHLREEYALQEKYLMDMIARIQLIFADEQMQGVEIISPEERKLLLEFLDTYAEKLNNVRNGGKNLETPDESKDIKQLSGLDILGFNPEQWQTTFDSLDTFSEKIAAVEMTIGALKNAFGMYFQFLEAGEKRNLQKFEANNRKKIADLDSQLEKGHITQEVYNAKKAKLETDLAKKKAEIEYKQAKREKAMNIISIIANTAVGVSKALAQGGILGIATGVIVAALGAVQLATAIKQPLPDKNGFKDGGYTGDGPNTASPGPVHYKEYVVPENILFSKDPVVPYIVGYLEQKRTGKQPEQSESSPTNSPSSNQTNSSTISQESAAVFLLLSRATDVLEKLEEDGFKGYLVNDIASAKKMRDKIKDLTKLENSAKA